MAPKEFMLVMSYNPGYQSVLKDLKPSTRQRMVSIELSFPKPDVEENILIQETGIDADLACQLIHLAQAIRKLQHDGLPEAASTRTLISAALLIKDGVELKEAVNAAITGPLTDDPVASRQLLEMVNIYMV
jgi:nitric oxide reductase NorQ protein